MTTRAYQRGVAKALHLKHLERRGIIAAAVCPYVDPAKRAEWQAGFRATYWTDAARGREG